MAPTTKSPPNARQARPARIEYLRVENYRALREIELRGITPLTVLLGPNGSGKSTVFDVFNFLSNTETVRAEPPAGRCQTNATSESKNRSVQLI